jgi:hypothetical protein
MVDNVAGETSWCSRCKTFWPADSFRLRTRSSGLRQRWCIGCEITTRTQRKAADPFMQKAKWTVSNHAIRYRMARREFVKLYGWRAARIAADMRRAWGHICVYCERPFSVRRGFGDLTLDIVRRADAPYYDTNVAFCCWTCNSEKRRMTPDAWARRLMFWRAYGKHWETRQPVKQLHFLGLVGT